MMKVIHFCGSLAGWLAGWMNEWKDELNVFVFMQKIYKNEY
jgi:hypothetical protein